MFENSSPFTVHLPVRYPDRVMGPDLRAVHFSFRWMDVRKVFGPPSRSEVPRVSVGDFYFCPSVTEDWPPSRAKPPLKPVGEFGTSPLSLGPP